MNLCNNNVFQINNKISFSLVKRKKRRVFGYYKAIRHSKQSNPTQNNICKLCEKLSLNNLLFAKEINLNFFSNINFTQKKEIIKEKRKSIFESRKEINNKNIKRSLTFNKKKVLIKPIMIEDNICQNEPKIQKNEEFSFNNIIDNFKYRNSYYNYNDLNRSNIFFDSMNSCNNNKNYIAKNYINNKNYYLNNKNLTDNPHGDLIEKNIFNKDSSIFKKYKSPFIFNNFELYPTFNNFYNFKPNKIIDEKINNNTFQFKTEKNNIILLDDKLNTSLASSSSPETTNNTNEDIHKEAKNNINKGRKTKNSNIESKHTKYSSDNMMRKIKNKAIESSRLLTNKILNEEFKIYHDCNFQYKEFRKIQGSFGQELNIKYNFWFYQITIKEIFCLEISNKYSEIQKSSNKELIDFLYSEKNKDKFIKTKKLLDTPFHQFYHDVFLGENPEWKKMYGIDENDNKFEIEYLLKNLEEEEKDDTYEEKNYINDINSLAHNYENFFLEKKPRNMDYKNKKNEFIKSFLNNSLNNEFSKLTEQVKDLREYYQNRKIKQKNNLFSLNNIIEYNINKSKILLKEEEEKQDIQENININKKDKRNYFYIVKKLKKYKNEIKEELNDNYFCNRKRNGQKIKYFISCKKAKNIDDSEKKVFC